MLRTNLLKNKSLEKQLSETGKTILAYFPKLAEHEGIHPDFKSEEQRLGFIEYRKKPILIGKRGKTTGKPFTYFEFTACPKHYDCKKLYQELTEGQMIKDRGRITHPGFESRQTEMKITINNKEYDIKTIGTRNPGIMNTALSFEIKPFNEKENQVIAKIEMNQIMPELNITLWNRNPENWEHLEQLVRFLFSKKLLPNH